MSEQTSGECPVCGRTLNVTAAGVIRIHGRERDTGQRLARCAGSGLPPSEPSGVTPVASSERYSAPVPDEWVEAYLRAKAGDTLEVENPVILDRYVAQCREGRTFEWVRAGLSAVAPLARRAWFLELFPGSDKPTEPSGVDDGPALRARYASEVARVEARALRREADLIEAHYPADVWHPASPSLDAAAARGIRHACKLLRERADEIEGIARGGDHG